MYVYTVMELYAGYNISLYTYTYMVAVNAWRLCSFGQENNNNIK